MGMVQVIVMTSDKNSYTLKGFFHLWQKYYKAQCIGIVMGFSKDGLELPSDFRFISQGNQDDYPRERWSERLRDVLDNVADEVFILLLDDYWLVRQVDLVGVKMIYDYMFQFQNVIKVDLATDRLYADGGTKYLYGYNTYNTLGHLDLIKSNFRSPYHMSLWGGMWSRNLLKRFIVPGESAQQIELNGTPRLAAVGDEVLVLGTRQAPLLHINALQGRDWNTDQSVGLPALEQVDRDYVMQTYYENAQGLSTDSN